MATGTGNTQSPIAPFDSVEFNHTKSVLSANVRISASALLDRINLIPSNRERSLAVTNLEQAIHWANRAIAVSNLGSE